ncbi:hypothetical protein AKO1_012746 [Acrasis kona]|uniref:Uncharacterized protein n=1 Tax=Acrasis kona TaxID=1008807 RepID=A0AAW2YW00_9EUKA
MSSASSPYKQLYGLNLKYEKNQIINPNPENARKHHAELILDKVPELVHIMIYGKSKDRIHAAFGLRNLTEEKRFRRPLGMSYDFIENVCALLMINQEGDAHKRCQQHALGILNNLLLEDPILDTFIANDENSLPGLAKMLRSTDRTTQELASKMLDYITVTQENQTLVCTSDRILSGVVVLLRNTKSNEVREHVLQALIYLSNNAKNSREENLLEELQRCITISDSEGTISQRAIQVLYNICLLKENIPVISRDPDIRQILRDKQHEVKKRLNSTEEKYKGFENDVITYKLTGVIADLLYTYDTRLNSKIILRGEGFNHSVITIGKHASRSIVEDSMTRSNRNLSFNEDTLDSPLSSPTKRDSRSRSFNYSPK